MRSIYETPEISVVELRPSEAVLQACKLYDNGPSAPGPNSLDDDCQSGLDQCPTLGS